MTYFSYIRAGLVSTALLLTTALASPALAESLPEISPRQIASDVKMQYNPQTGAQEYIAPSFDPFEEDRNMAGTASLRSVSQATTIDGQSVRGGALLDMTFYYNSQSNDPYDTRGYEDAVYLSGEYAPVTRRDNRILECNEKVQDVVYYHEDYYSPSVYVNLYRPYRHYRGHYGYGRGYGYDYGRGYGGHRGYYGGPGYRRGYGGDRRRDRNRRNTTDRIVDRAVEEARRTLTQREERAATGRLMDRTPSARQGRDEDRRVDRNRRRDRTETRRGGRDGFLGGPRRLGTYAGAAGRRSQPSRTVTPRAATRAQRAPSTESAPRTERAPRVQNNSLAGAAARRAAPRIAALAPRPERAAPAPRPQRAERSRPSRTERAVNRARSNKTYNAPRRSRGHKGNAKLRMMSFLPMASSWSRNVVRNVDTQCAREEMLTVHISQERLDAARFDGLTVLVLDRAGSEIPVYLPPNYVEGFRQAVNGRAAPNVSYQKPQMAAPVYQAPRPSTKDSAPCPVGTTQQSDGTCLQGGTVTYGGYPTR